MKTPHKHAELIKQWADGAVIQRYNKTLQQWRDCDYTMLNWNPLVEFRVKPEPKPDIVRYQSLGYYEMGPYTDTNRDNATIMFVFDGETGELKDAQVLAHV